MAHKGSPRLTHCLVHWCLCKKPCPLNCPVPPGYPVPSTTMLPTEGLPKLARVPTVQPPALAPSWLAEVPLAKTCRRCCSKYTQLIPAHNSAPNILAWNSAWIYLQRTLSKYSAPQFAEKPNSTSKAVSRHLSSCCFRALLPTVSWQLSGRPPKYVRPKHLKPFVSYICGGEQHGKPLTPQAQQYLLPPASK